MSAATVVGVRRQDLDHLTSPTPDGWEWDGDRNEPTLAPSIHRVPERGGCGWHGFLRRGTWVSV